jgi:hypothetical protein
VSSWAGGSSWVSGRPYSQQYEYLLDVIAGAAPLDEGSDPIVELDVLCDEIWDTAQAHPDVPSPYKSGRPRPTGRRAVALELLNRVEAWLRRRIGGSGSATA